MYMPNASLITVATIVHEAHGICYQQATIYITLHAMMQGILELSEEPGLVEQEEHSVVASYHMCEIRNEAA